MAITNVRLRRLSGYSLVELMIVAAILGAMTVAASIGVRNFIRYAFGAQKEAEVQRDAHTAITLVVRQLRSGVASSAVIDALAGNPPSSRISVTMMNGTDLTFQQNGHRLEMIKGATASTLVTDSLQTAFFFYPDSTNERIVGISIACRKNNFGTNSVQSQLSNSTIQLMN